MKPHRPSRFGKAGKGSALVGSDRKSLPPGERLIAKPAAEANGMFRMLVGYSDQEKKLIPCYDRYIPYNPDSRDILLFFPDATTGMRVYSLSEFGPFE